MRNHTAVKLFLQFFFNFTIGSSASICRHARRSRLQLNQLGKVVMGLLHIFHPALARRSSLDVPPPRLRHETIRRVINAFATDMTEESRRRLAALDPADADAIRHAPQPVIAFSPAMAEANHAVKEFLFAHMYRHWRVKRQAAKSRRVTEALFQLLHEDTSLLPDGWRPGSPVACCWSARPRFLPNSRTAWMKSGACPNPANPVWSPCCGCACWRSAPSWYWRSCCWCRWWSACCWATCWGACPTTAGGGTR